MQVKTGTFLCITVVMMLAAAACSPLLPASPAPAVLATATPDLIGTALAGTLTALPTPSFTLLPPSRTPTVTKTQFPTITPIPSESPIPSSTPKGAGPTATVSGTPSAADYACQIVSKSPANWTIFKARAAFDSTWTIKNVGIKPWRIGQVKLTYVSGAKLYGGEKSYPLASDVKPGTDPVTFIADMVAPKAAGDYSSFWGLIELKTNTVFCSFTTRITVK